MKKVLILTFMLSIFIYACSPEEKIINNISNSDQLLVATNEDVPKLKILEIPSLKVIEDDLIRNKLNIDISSPIDKIKSNGNFYYLIIASENKIYVIKKLDLTIENTIDFSDEGFEPVDIVFANSTDAYVIHRNSVYCSLVDLTVFKPARQITVGNPPHSIAINGNQIFVANTSDNTISVIDSRDRNTVHEISTEPKPLLLDFSSDGNTLVCITAGNGKLNDSEEKSPALVQFIDKKSRNIFKTIELGFAQIDPLLQHPVAFKITSSDWGFILTKDNFLRLDVKSKDRINLISKTEFHFITSDIKNESLILLYESQNSYRIIYANDRNGEIEETYTLPYNIKSVCIK